MAAFVEAYDEAIKAPVGDYFAHSQKIGGDVQKHVGYSVAGIKSNPTTSDLITIFSTLLNK